MACYRKSPRPQRKTGIDIQCKRCGKSIYIQNCRTKNKNHFCSIECANQALIKDKLKFQCVICQKNFEIYPSTAFWSKKRGQKIQYCSIECRNKDPKRIEMLRNMNASQSLNKVRNKLETAGKAILEELKIEFVEQELINGKILVDIFIPKHNLIIEWWGDYWHGHPSKIKDIPDKRQTKRMALDKSQKKYFKKCGFQFLSFWEHELKEKDKVSTIIKEKLEQSIF